MYTSVDGHFDVYFIGAKKSICTGIPIASCQISILIYHLPDATERMVVVRDIIDTDPEDTAHLFEENPLQFGFYLHSISYKGGV